MAHVQNSGAGRGRSNGNNPPGGRGGPHKGDCNDRMKPLLTIPRGFADVLRFCGVGDRYNLFLTCHQPESADHRANWMNCGNCDEHGSAHRGSVCLKLRPMNDDFWRSHTGSSRDEVYGRSRSGPAHNEERRARKQAARHQHGEARDCNPAASSPNAFPSQQFGSNPGAGPSSSPFQPFGPNQAAAGFYNPAQSPSFGQAGGAFPNAYQPCQGHYGMSPYGSPFGHPMGSQPFPMDHYPPPSQFPHGTVLRMPWSAFGSGSGRAPSRPSLYRAMAAAARFRGRRNQADAAEAAVVEEELVGQPPTVQAHAAADMAIEDEPSEQQPTVQTSAVESTAQVSNPASDGPIIKQEETEPATKLDDVSANDASQEVSSRMAELETQIQQVAASLSSNRASGIADQLAQLVGEYHSLTLIQEIGADDEERLDAKGPGSSSSLCKVMSCGFGIEVGR
jgi:hypothetical protein